MPNRRRFALALALVVSLLLAGCTTSEPDTRGADFDEDGLPDVDESNGWGVVAERQTGRAAYEVTSDPQVADSDGDGLGDADEYRTLTDPRNVDTDADGLLDGASVCNPGAGGRSERPTETDSQDPSPDAPDFVSLNIVRDPSNPSCFVGEEEPCTEAGGLSALNWDSDKPDGDGISDGDEVRGWTMTVRGEERHVRTNPCRPDTDADGITDGDERERGTDPTSRDTDRDGAFDGFDADPLTDLGLEVTLVSLRLAEDAPENATLRFAFSVQGMTRTFERPVNGSFSENVTLVADVDDTTVDPGSLLATVFYRVQLMHEDDSITDVDVGGRTWNGSQVRVDYDLVQEAGRVGGEADARDGPTIVTEGAGGTVELRYTVTRD